MANLIFFLEKGKILKDDIKAFVTSHWKDLQKVIPKGTLSPNSQGIMGNYPHPPTAKNFPGIYGNLREFPRILKFQNLPWVLADERSRENKQAQCKPFQCHLPCSWCHHMSHQGRSSLVFGTTVGDVITYRCHCTVPAQAQLLLLPSFVCPPRCPLAVYTAPLQLCILLSWLGPVYLGAHVFLDCFHMEVTHCPQLRLS